MDEILRRSLIGTAGALQLLAFESGIGQLREFDLKSTLRRCLQLNVQGHVVAEMPGSKPDAFRAASTVDLIVPNARSGTWRGALELKWWTGANKVEECVRDAFKLAALYRDGRTDHAYLVAAGPEDLWAKPLAKLFTDEQSWRAQDLHAAHGRAFKELIDKGPEEIASGIKTTPIGSEAIRVEGDASWMLRAVKITTVGGPAYRLRGQVVGGAASTVAPLPLSDSAARTDKPRSNAEPAERARKEQLLEAPHVAALTAYVERLRSQRGAESAVPWFDPTEAGVGARILLLLEAPGRLAGGPSGSQFISPDNNDATAQNMWNLLRDAGIDRNRQIVTWNVVPWYLGTATNARTPSAGEISDARTAVVELLELLPDLRVVVLLGQAAAQSWARLGGVDVNALVMQAPHPSPRNLNSRPENRAKILEALIAAREHLDASIDEDA